MDESSMLCEHTLLTSGETAMSGAAYAGWPARQLDDVFFLERVPSGASQGADIPLARDYSRMDHIRRSMTIARDFTADSTTAGSSESGDATETEKDTSSKTGLMV